MRTDDQGVTMRAKNRGATIAVGIGLALAAALPAAQAKAPSVDRPATSFYSARALNALGARWNAEAASFSGTARAQRAVDARWNAEARSFGRSTARR
jgi:type IV secretory pathway TrbL component